MSNQKPRGKGKRQAKPRRNDAFSPKNREQNIDEKEQNNEIFFGKHVVFNIFNENKQVNKLFIQKGVSGPQITDILALVKQQGVVYQEVPKSKLDELTNGGNHQGVAVTTPAFQYQSLEDIFALAEERNEAPFILVLDGIEDPHNLGSILRTADATGVHGVIIPKRRAVGLTGIVAKTSTGAIEHVPVVRVTNIAQAIEQLKEKGVWVFATAMNGEDMRTWNSQGAIALVIGNEGHGVSQLVEESADGTITIPMVGHVQSLNASVAAAVLMYEVARNRVPMPPSTI